MDRRQIKVNAPCLTVHDTTDVILSAAKNLGNEA